MSSILPLCKGVVVDNNDPMKMCRVKLRLPNVLCHSVTDWVNVVQDIAHTIEGSIKPLPKGAQVFVGFEGNQIDRPIVLGCLYFENKVPLENRDSYPDIGEKHFPDGSKLLIDKKNSIVKFEFGECSGQIDYKEAIVEMEISGTNINIDSNGNIKVTPAIGAKIILGDETVLNDAVGKLTPCPISGTHVGAISCVKIKNGL